MCGVFTVEVYYYTLYKQACSSNRIKVEYCPSLHHKTIFVLRTPVLAVEAYNVWSISTSIHYY